MPKKIWTLSCKSAVRSYMGEMQVSRILGHLFPPCSKGKQRCFCHGRRGGEGNRCQSDLYNFLFS